MLLFTSFAPSSRVFVAYFLAIFFLVLGGLVSLQVHENLALSDLPLIRGASASKKIVQDDAKFSWDLVRISSKLAHMCNR